MMKQNRLQNLQNRNHHLTMTMIRILVLAELLREVMSEHEVDERVLLQGAVV